MSLAVGIQMDPIETINIDADSTFVLALEAQSRGHGLYHYHPRDLSLRHGRLYARARKLEVRRKAGDHATLGQPQMLDLATLDVVLLRQDPPFDMAYITSTHLLEHIHPQTLVVNDPAEVRNAPEKLFVAHFPQLMPPTLITSDRLEINEFRREHKDIIVKPLFGNGGAGVFHIRPDDENLNALLEMFTQIYREPSIVQRYVPEPACRRQSREGGAVVARPRDLRRDRPGPEEAWPGLRRHRRDRKLPDRDQRHLADRAAGDQPAGRDEAGGGAVGCDRRALPGPAPGPADVNESPRPRSPVGR